MDSAQRCHFCDIRKKLRGLKEEKFPSLEFNDDRYPGFMYLDRGEQNWDQYWERNLEKLHNESKQGEGVISERYVNNFMNFAIEATNILNETEDGS